MRAQQQRPENLGRMQGQTRGIVLLPVRIADPISTRSRRSRKAGARVRHPHRPA
jgi:hypothetical protein